MSPGSLRDELEAFVSYDEPPFASTGPQVRQIAARKRTRRRRMIAGGAAVLAVVAVGSAYALAQPGDNSRQVVASEGPVRVYSAAAFPQVIESVVADTLGAAPSSVSISAFDAGMNPLDGPKRDSA